MQRFKQTQAAMLQIFKKCAALVGLCLLLLPALASAQSKMYWTDQDLNTIKRANLDGSNTEDLFPGGAGVPRGLALDTFNDKMYWTAFDEIRRADLDGSNVEAAIAGLAVPPEGLALDVLGGKIYWFTQSGVRQILRANFDGSGLETLLTVPGSPSDAINGLALDLNAGKMYWTFAASLPTDSKISRANLDGSTVEDLVTAVLDLPVNIALDVTNGRMYWADSRNDVIQRAFLDGSGLETLASGVTGANGVAVDIPGGKLYWTDQIGSSIFRANFDGSGVENISPTGADEPEVLALDLQPAAPTQSQIYWNERAWNTIQRANLDGSNLQDLFPFRNIGSPYGLALDTANEQMYWTDRDNLLIRRADLDGDAVETLISGLADMPNGIALDVAGGKMYWTTQTSPKILRANLDGSGMQTLVTLGGTGAINAIALDPANGKMYWTMRVGVDIKIQRANLNGTGVEDLITTGLDEPFGIALDVAGGKMYWVDRGDLILQRANLDGSGVEFLANAEEDAMSIGLDLSAGKMYWSDPGASDNQRLIRANLNGTALEYLTVAADQPEFISLDIQGGATSTFAGLPNTSLGSASLSLDLNNDLVISNLGASGNDGVSFFLGQAQFGAVQTGLLALSPGAFVQASAIGSLNNVPGQTISTITLTGVSGGNTNVQFDLSAVSDMGPDAIVYNGATQVFRGVVPGNSVEVAGSMGPDIIPFQPQSAPGGGANAIATVFLRQKFPISIPGGPTVTGDRIVALAENISASVEYVSEISVTGANLSSFTLEAEAVGLFGTNLHEAVGNAQITSSQQLATSQLTVSNLGASLLDGVEIDVEEAGTVTPCFLVGLAAVPLSGVNEQVHFEAVGHMGPDAFGAVDLLATGSGFDVNVDYAPLGASLVNVMVFNAGVPVGSAIVPAGTVGTITAAASPIALTRTFVEAAGMQGPDVLVGFQNPVGFAFATLANISGEGRDVPAERLYGDIPSSMSFRPENGASRSEETSAQEGDASAREGPYRMTVMGGANATVETGRRPVSTNASVVLGDEIRFEAVDYTVIPGGITSVKLLMANVPEFTIINEATEAPSPRVLVSNGAITIDRSKHSASKGDLHSNATITFKKGDPTTFTGNLSAVGKITIDKDNTIVGNATSGSTISVAGGSSITGIRTPNAAVASIPISVVSFTAGGANITVPKNGTRTINPGSYGNVTVGNSAKLNLKSGEYRFVKLETQNGAFLNFDVSNGGVQVKVTSSLKIDDEVTVTITPSGEVNSNSVDFITLQSSKVSLDKESYVLGTLIAPNAEVFLDKSVSFRGAIMAKKITVDRDVVFVHHTSPGVLPLPKASGDEEATSDQQPVTSYQLEQNYPNPFNPSTTIRFALPEAGEVSLVIYNINGQLVREVINGQYDSGRHSVVWDGKDARGLPVASGVYFYKLQAGPSTSSGQAFVARKKLLLMK